MLRSIWFWGLPALWLLVIAGLVFISPIDALVGVQRLTRTTPDLLWWWLTWLGDTHFALAMFLAAAIATGHRRASPALLWSIAPATLTLHGIKALAAAPRPAAVLPPDAFHLIGDVLRQGSFPSGHTVTAFTLAACWVLTTPPPQRRLAAAAALPLAFAIGLSRVAVGAHWPLDVAVGALLGWLCAAAAVVAARRWGPRPGDVLHHWEIAAAGVLGLGLWGRALPASVEPLAHALGGLVVGVALVAAALQIWLLRSSAVMPLWRRRETE
ncbi:phosphatase PAP2 family protein [Tepidimonas sp.]|uniref:phosphatase PAP2 family protein n=1 Tax=Tepidimonas sp. TaxID=2002775 RepID=UPI00391C2E4A